MCHVWELPQEISPLEEESQSAVVHHLNVSQSTISRLAARFNTFATTNDRPRAGSPRVTTPAQDRYTRGLHLRDRTATAVNTAARIPGQTVRNRLPEHGLRARTVYVGNVLGCIPS